MNGAAKIFDEEAKGDVDAMKRLFADFKPAMIAELEDIEKELNDLAAAPSSNSPRKRARTRRNHRKSRRS